MTDAAAALLAALHWVAPVAAFASLHAVAEHDARDASSRARLRRLSRLCGGCAWAAWTAAIVADIWLWTSLGVYTRWHNGALAVAGAALLAVQLRATRVAA